MSKVFNLGGWLSGSTRVLGAVAPPPPPPPVPEGHFRTYVGSSALDQSVWGTFATPDTVIGSFGSGGGTNLVNAGGFIDGARGAGGGKTPPSKLILRANPGNANLKDANGNFSPSLWKASFLAWKNAVQAVSGGETKLRAAVADGLVPFLMVLDDFSSGSLTFANSFATAVTYTQLEDICAYAKVTLGWNWLPLVARGNGTYLKSTATVNGVVRQYAHLDAAWAMFRFDINGAPATWLASEWGAANACGLGCAGGANVLNGGTGTVAGWGAQHPDSAKLFGMAPSEITTIGFAELAEPRVTGFNCWSYGISGAATTYFTGSAIAAALAAVYNASIGRVDGPVNVRGDLAAP